MQKIIFLILASIFLFLMGIDFASAQIEIPGGEQIQKVSITATKMPDGKTDLGDLQGFGGSILGVAKTIISGFALIYIVLIGVYMVVHSDDEGELKKQKTQLLYVILGFIFLNIPSAIYELFMVTSGKKELSQTAWTSVNASSVFWNNGTGAFSIGKFLEDII